MIFHLLLLSSALLFPGSVAFVPKSSFLVPPSSTRSNIVRVVLNAQQLDENDDASRRDFVQSMAATSSGLLSFLLFPSHPASASGGATAGGAYLLSAKQRYNERVKAGVKAFLSLAASLEGGSLSEAKTFFAGEDEGTWKDLATAGYLLANAFRTSSTTPPDRLPSVKKWKAFEAEVIGMQKAVKKKESKGSLAAYQKAMDALDAYLDSVELPPSLELK